jgi:hypothetical protein
MMRIIICISLLIAYLLQGFGQPIFETKYKQTIVQLRIKSQTNFDYNYVKNKLSSKGVKTSYTEYNANGDIVKFITYKLKDTLTLEEYTYDETGKRIDYTKHKGSSKNIAYQKISKYNKEGKLIQEHGFDGSERFKNSYKYNSDNKLKEINYFLDNELNEKRTFIHDGDITEVKVYNALKQITSYMTLKYNSKRDIIEEIVYDANRNPLEKKLYVYNNESKVVSEVKYRLEQFYYKLTYLYDSKSNLINIDEESINNKRYVKKSFGYDSSGNLIEMKWRRKPGEEFNQRNYSYDTKGLCTLVITFYPSTNFKVLTKYEYEFF